MKSVVSVVIPIYNKEKYLEKCLQSIVEQTYTGLEIILIDDGSTDDSLEICRKWEKIDKRIRVFTHENHGAAYTRNFGIEKAQGEIISFVDADDYLDTNTYEICVEELEEEKADACYFGRYPVAKGEILSHYLSIPEKIVYEEEEIKSNLVKNFFGPLPGENPRNYISGNACTVVFSRKVMEEHQICFENIKQNEDSLFNLQFTLNAKKVIAIPHILYYYCINTESVSRSYTGAGERFQELKACYLKMIEYAKSFPNCSDAKKRAQYRFWINIHYSIRVEMLHRKVIGMKQVYKNIRIICNSKETREVAEIFKNLETQLKKKLFVFLVRKQMVLGLMIYFYFQEIKASKFPGKIK